MRGSISLCELYSVLEDLGDVGGDISLSSILQAIKSKLPSGQRYSGKHVTHVARKRFTEENMLYTQLFVNFLYRRIRKKLNFSMNQEPKLQTLALAVMAMLLWGFEASKATNMLSERPTIEIGNIIIIDNLGVHH